MKMEKQVKAHTRRTKSGKSVMVKAHSAKYDSGGGLAKKNITSKRGSGKELMSKAISMASLERKAQKAERDYYAGKIDSNTYDKIQKSVDSAIGYLRSTPKKTSRSTVKKGAGRR